LIVAVDSSHAPGYGPPSQSTGAPSSDNGATHPSSSVTACAQRASSEPPTAANASPASARPRATGPCSLARTARKRARASSIAVMGTSCRSRGLSGERSEGELSGSDQRRGARGRRRTVLWAAPRGIRVPPTAEENARSASGQGVAQLLDPLRRALGGGAALEQNVRLDALRELVEDAATRGLRGSDD